MAALQMIELLRRGAEFHGNLAAFYERMSHEAKKEEVRLVLSYMSLHENLLEQCILAYEKNAPRAVAEAWFMAVPPLDGQHLIENAAIPEDATVHDIVERALTFDDCLISVYRQLAESAIPDGLRDALDSLLTLEREEEKRLVRDLVHH